MSGHNPSARRAGSQHGERSTREVLESHLAMRQAGDLECDLVDNYADDVVLRSWGEGVSHGHDGVRTLARVLRTYVESGSYTYHQLLTDRAYGMLRWTASYRNVRIDQGTDSFVVRNGRIVAQTIAYAVDNSSDEANA